MEADKVQEIAEKLNTARLEARPIAQFGDSLPDFPRNAAYDIQNYGLKLRIASGEKLIGLKMGLTSEAKRKQMDLDAPLYGVLTDKMQISNGGKFSLAGTIHPKIEPEIAFFISEQLKGEVTREEVLSACSHIYPALEILDSRYEQFKYFSMEEVISDNSSSSHFILGESIKDFRQLDLKNLKMQMLVDGEVTQEGHSSAISGDPVMSVIELCRLLQQRNESLQAGMIVLAGAATAAVPLKADMTIELEVENMTKTTVKVKAS